ncbi:hypothetical protein EST38_g13912 [Candolleomyces aberdarensis]|uniref:Calcineurin-like phosphoesterase domain-containing protein n=1 Tax=Candolleomyces aberdarensis TaxID=2316362 RepID=A0A4Q2D1E8_9AGAR|nr:hypothetical protein EST38_g13912 [Candolleomyces aberdarensis]
MVRIGTASSLIASPNVTAWFCTQEESEALLEAFAEKSADIREADKSKGEFVFLNRKRYDIGPNISILGCTLWASLNPENLDILSWSLTDFKRIVGFDPEGYQKAHETDLTWLKQSVETIRNEEPERKIVVFTHHAPTVEGTGDPRFIGGPTTSAFATELTVNPWWGSPIALWAFGHTHWCCDFERKGVRVVSNQKGYGDGATGFDVKKVLAIN